MTNRPDMIIKNTKEKTYLLIDVAIEEDRNIKQNEPKKKLQYKILIFEDLLQRKYVQHVKDKIQNCSLNQSE